MSETTTIPACEQIYIWQYNVRAERVDDFVRIYGPDGKWAKLFANSTGYRGTALLRDPAQSNLFVTVDAWDSPSAFETFKHEQAVEYALLDQQCEQLMQDETFVGAYTRNSSR